MLGLFNADLKMFDGISFTTKLDDQISCLFIDFDGNLNNIELFEKQSEILERFLRKIPVIIYDRNLSLTNEEISYLKRFNVTLLEPALNNRPNFEYLPYYIETRTFEEMEYVSETSKNIEFIYDGPFKNGIYSEFEKYFSKLSQIIGNGFVHCSNRPIKEKETQYHDYGIIFDENILTKLCKFTILIGTDEDYRIGYIPPINELLKNNVIPLLPTSHRYFHSMFLDSVVDSLLDIEFYRDKWQTIYLGLILDIYKRIEKYYPEMLLENINKKLNEYVRRAKNA